MKRLSPNTRGLLAVPLSLALLACGSTAATTGARADGASADGRVAGSAGTAGVDDRRELRDDDFTRREIEEVKAPVYLDEIDREAQDAFREGVRLVTSATPDYPKALAQFRTAAEKDPTFLEAYFNWAMVLERTGRADEALAVYQRALERNPGDSSAEAYIAKIYLAKAQEAKFKGRDGEEKEWLAKSKSLLDALLRKEPDNVAVNNAMALYFLSLDDLETAERYVKEVLYVQPTNVTGLNTRGLINLKRGKYLIARWIFENKVLTVDPTSTEALTNLGYTYIKLEQRPLAMQFFTRALEADPDNAAVRMNIAAMLLEHLDYAGALDHYERVLVAQPNEVEAKIGRCDAIYGLSGTASDKPAQYEAAIACYLAFLKDAPDRTDLYRRIAETYQNKMQNYEKAVEYFEIYGKQAKLTPADADRNQKIIATLKDIIASGGLKAPGADMDTDSDDPTGDGF